MPRDRPLHVLCYDISSNHRRRKVAAILEDYATRVQGSVFEGRLSDAALALVVKKVRAVIAENDNFRVYVIGRTGERHCLVVGCGIPIESEASYWMV